MIARSRVSCSLGAGVTDHTFDMANDELVTQPVAVSSGLTADGIRLLVASGITHSTGAGRARMACVVMIGGVVGPGRPAGRVGMRMSRRQLLVVQQRAGTRLGAFVRGRKAFDG